MAPRDHLRGMRFVARLPGEAGWHGRQPELLYSHWQTSTGRRHDRWDYEILNAPIDVSWRRCRNARYGRGIRCYQCTLEVGFRTRIFYNAHRWMEHVQAHVAAGKLATKKEHVIKALAVAQAIAQRLGRR